MNYKTIPRRFNISSAEMALIVTVIIGVLVNSSQFATVDNAYNIVRQFVTNAIIALGMAFVIISGSIDLSVSSVMVMGAFLAMRFVHISLALAILVPLAFGVLIGAINATLITKVNFPPMMATYSTQMLVKGIVLVLTGGSTYKPLVSHEAFSYLGFGDIFGVIPFSLAFFVVIFVICFFSIKRIPLVRNVYAVGGDAIHLPSNVPHGAFIRDVDCKAIDIFVPSRKDYIAKFQNQNPGVEVTFIK